MKPVTALTIKYQAIIVALALLGGITKWVETGFYAGLFFFIWLFVLFNLPTLWYAGKAWFVARRRRGRDSL